MTTREISQVTWVEQYYHLNSRFPSVGAWLSRFPNSPIEEFLAHPTVQLALHNRGIKIPQETSTDLTDEQLAAVMMIADTADRRSFTAKLKSLDINSQKWNGWKKDPHFLSFLDRIMGDSLKNSYERVIDGLLKAVDRGDVTAIKLFMELTGRSPDAQQINFRVQVARLIEAIQKHVRDPDVLDRISQEFRAGPEQITQ